MIDPQDGAFSLRQQCGLLGVNRSSLYYQPREESEENLGLMRLLDEQYTRTPYYGVLRMVAYLRSLGHEVNPKRVRRLLRTMGLEALYQKPNISKPNPEHTIYPYLLRGLAIERCDQLWSTDITYVRLASGFVYLMAVLDWYSRYVLGWALSTTLDADFCIEAVGKILEQRQCDIFNTDQGAQFTTPRFTQPLLDRGASRSAWTGEDGHWTTFLWNGSGGRSSMSMSICRKYRQSGRPGWGCGAFSTSTTMSVSISHWTTGHRLKSTSRGYKTVGNRQLFINPPLS